MATVPTHPDAAHVGPTTPSLLIRAARRWGDLPAFASADRVMTYRQILEFLGRAQAALAAVGVQPGDFVAILGRNGAEAWLMGMAAVAMNARVTNLHPMGSLHDHLRVIEVTETRHVVVDPRAYPARGQEIAEARPDLKVHALGPAGFGPDLIARMEAVGAATVRDAGDPLDIGNCNFTGGTTGAPKAIMTRRYRHAANMLAFHTNYELPARPRALATGPITHVSGSLLIPTFMRGGVVHMQPGFDPEAVVRIVARERIDTALMVPTMVYTLLDSPALAGADLSSLEFVVYSGAPMSPARLLQAQDRLGRIFAQLYAQAEAGVISYMPRDDHDPAHPERFAACGFALPECQVRLLDDEGQEVAMGETGEICVRAPFSFEGYHNNPEATAQVLKNGWVHTGDVARADEQGRLYIVDRKKDMIVSGGFNVYPREVEDVISTLAEVSACAVIGEPHERWGEQVCAYVMLKPGAQLPPEAVIQAVKQVKGSVHAPKTVRFVDALPMTGNGKVDKKPLRDAAWAGAARKVN